MATTTNDPDVNSVISRRSVSRPVFIVGCPRSGTTLLYHMLLSSGGFAVYRTETHLFNMLAPKFGDLGSRRNRQKFFEHWLKSKYFRLSGLHPEDVRDRVLHECQNWGDFLRIIMEAIACSQGVNRWAENTPEHVLHLHDIKRNVPDALILHLIRDARDAALSLNKQGWVRPYPWDRDDSLLVAGLYWEWLVTTGRNVGRDLGSDYMEVSYERLVEQPAETLATIAPFIQHDLNYENIRRVAIGSVGEPNTSFASQGNSFKPLGRWKQVIPKGQLARFEALVGDTMKECGYELATPPDALPSALGLNAMRALYEIGFRSRQWMKMNTPLARIFVNTESMYE